jgi:hypothetical protein
MCAAVVIKEHRVTCFVSELVFTFDLELGGLALCQGHESRPCEFIGFSGNYHFGLCLVDSIAHPE